jgi:predicted transcriptional regulator
MVKEEIVLENDIRRMLYNHIITYPGVTYSVLKNIFGLTDSALRYHLDYLEKCERITSGMDTGIRCYYPHEKNVIASKISTENNEVHKLTQQQEQILETIKFYPGINQKELVNRTRINRFQVSKNIKILQNMNLVNQYRLEKNICYEYVPDEEMKFKMIKRLVIKLLKNEIDEETFLRLVKKMD